MKRIFARILVVIAALLLHLPMYAALPETLVFFGDNNLPPYQFLENGTPKGASVDVARAIGRVLGRPVEIRLMHWDEAQRRFLAGEGNAISLLARTPEREAHYDFTQETLPVSFSLFVRADRRQDFDPGNLDGKRIGVIRGSFSDGYIQKKHPRTPVVFVADNIDGSRKLMRGEIDALAANTWSELYLLKELGINGITPLPPFHEGKSNIGVHKGDQVIQSALDDALGQLKASGEFDRIIDQWSASKIHLLSDIAVRMLYFAGTVVVLALAVCAFAIMRLQQQKHALSREIAERRRVESALLNNQSRLDLALDSARIGMYDWDFVTQGLLWTKRQSLMLGVDPDSVAPNYEVFRQCVHSEDIDQLERNLKAARDQRLDYKHEFRVVWPNGKLRYIATQGRFFYDDAGKAIRLLGVSIDITESREANEAVARSERQFATLVENSPDIFARLDLSLRYLYVSSAIKRHTGFSPQRLIGKTNTELGMPHELCAYWDAEMREAIRTRNIRSISFTYPLAGERLRFFEARAVPETDVRGAVESLLVVVTDVTEREQMTRALKERERQLQESDRRKDEFLAMLAHELRNPLAPIQNAVQLLKISADPDIQRNARDIIGRQLGHLVQLVNDLLDVNRINRGKLQLRRQVMDISVAVHNAIETSQPLIAQKRHSLEVSLPDRPAYINGDLTRLTQVIANLLNNSTKYTPDGGRIRLDLQEVSGEVILKVRDNGAGIPPEKLPAIFDMFSQVDHGPEHIYGGLGIGLALVRQLVDMHGGFVDARSEGSGKGTELIVHLPAVAAPPGVAPDCARSENAAPRARRVKVLVVDDNIDNAESLTALLELLGYEIATAHDGIVALQRVESFRPDVVFLDIGLPGLSGHEVARRIRARPDFAQSFLVAVSGWGQADDLMRSERAGFDRHIVKPVTFAALKEVLADAVEA